MIAVDVWGMGQTRPLHRSFFDNGTWAILFDVKAAMAYMAWSMDESLLGMRVQDVIRSVDYAGESAGGGSFPSSPDRRLELILRLRSVPTKGPVPIAKALEAYQFAQDTYGNVGTCDRFEIVERNAEMGPAQQYRALLSLAK